MTVVRSFDFWDTLVTRLVIHPSIVFEILERMSGEVGYAQARIEAERQSRQKVSETSLSRIYDRLDYEEIKRNRLMNMERELEVNLSSPIGAMVGKLSPVDIVVSDMYLSAEDLIKIATNCGLVLNPDRLIVSCEHYKTKHRGTLFDYALSRFNIVSHIGDNRQSDFLMPSSKGIRAIHFTDCRPNKLEEHWAARRSTDRYMAGILRSARLSCPSTSDLEKKQWEIYAQITAPVLYAFVEWILDDCGKRGIRDVFFLARDGQILHRIAIAICRSRDLPFNCKYIYASRQSLHLPGYVSIEQATTWILDDTAHLSLKTIADRTGIAVEDVVKISSRWFMAHPESNLGTEHRALLRNVVNSSDFILALSIASDIALTAAVKYYESVGLGTLTDGCEKAIVDVGWNGRIQQSLENIIGKIGGKRELLQGYYLALSNQCVFPTGARVRGYLSDPYGRGNFNPWVDRHRQILELFLAADHPSVLGFLYDDISNEPKPVFGCGLSPKQIIQIQFRQEAIMSFVSALNRFESTVGFRIGYDKSHVVTRMQQLFIKPTLIEAKSFRRDFVSEQQVESNFIPLVKKISLLDLFGRSRVYRWGCWAEGSFASSGILWVFTCHTLLAAVKEKFYANTGGRTKGDLGV